MNRPEPNLTDLAWPEDLGRVPYRVYTDPALYTAEQRRIFRGPTWSFVALEAELPDPYDYKATFVGDTPVVVTRDGEGDFHAWVNRCSHRGAMVCRNLRGRAETHTCVYHQWAFDPQGNCIGVPFRRGHQGRGGYPADFDPAAHPLRTLRVETFAGLVFASFSPEAPPLADYLGAEMSRWLERVLCRPLVFLGATRQHIHSNWKLYTENTKDPYHASLLHLFHATFNVYRSSMGGGCTVGGLHGMHSLLRAFTIEEEDKSEYERGGLRSYAPDVTLADPSLLDVYPELDPVFTNHIQSIFPSMVLQQIHNTLAVRQILPKAVDRFELVFHFFGYADDPPEVRAARLKQANLVGPAGYISMEDGEATELVQQAIAPDPEDCSLMAMGQSECGDEESLLSETLLRAFWRGYRELMGVGVPVAAG